VHLFSAQPLVIYIDGFLTGEEADALIELRWVAMFATNVRRDRANVITAAKTNGSLAPSSMVALRHPTTMSASPTKHSFLVRHSYNASNPVR
jgi:hypothetical protein